MRFRRKVEGTAGEYLGKSGARMLVNLTLRLRVGRYVCQVTVRERVATGTR